MRLEQALARLWRRRGLGAWLLWPLSRIYALLLWLHQTPYRRGWRARRCVPVPVIVVGNVVVGGAGKTPTTLALVRHLQSRGWRPGVISRGYGRLTGDCREVRPDSPADEVGDEALLTRRRAQVPVFVARRRAEAAQALLAACPQTSILVCDDGLQHLALARDIDLCVFDERGLGNGFLLPAGPLREPWPLRRGVRPVRCLALNTGTHAITLPGPVHQGRRRLAGAALRCDGTAVPLSSLRGRPLVALAGIARPQAFFDMLAAQGLTLAQTQFLPDHYDFDSWKAPSDVDLTVICTEKDAVKLWLRHPQALAVPLELDLPASLLQAVDAALPARAGCL